MTDGDVALFESGAILLYLANSYGGLSGKELGVAAQWTLFGNSTFCEAFFGPGGGGGKSPAATAILETLDRLLGEKPYLAGDSFTVSDIAVGCAPAARLRLFPERPSSGSRPSLRPPGIKPSGGLASPRPARPPLPQVLPAVPAALLPHAGRQEVQARVRVHEDARRTPRLPGELPGGAEVRAPPQSQGFDFAARVALARAAR